MSDSTAKRQKLNEDNASEFNTSECVTFDTLVDSQYPLDLITENMLRLLNYDPIEGLGELLSLAVHSAGCNALFLLKADLTNDERIAIGEQIEASCLRSEQGCPASYPIQKSAYAKRATELLALVATSLQGTGNFEALHNCCSFVAALSLLRLQSLRYVATVFLGAFLSVCDPLENHLDSQVTEKSSAGLQTRDEAFNILVRALKARCADVNVSIRKRAVIELAGASPSDVARSLFDPIGSVRLAAIKTLSTLDLTGSSEGLPRFNIKEINRHIMQVACRDAELPVRKAALRYLLANNILVDEHEFVRILYDEDEISRKLASELIVNKISKRAKSARAALVSLVKLLKHTKEALSALAAGLEKARGQYQVQWPTEIVLTLITDYDKESRKTKLAVDKRKELKALSVELGNEETQSALLQLLEACIDSASLGSASILEHVQPLVHKVQHSDLLLSLALVAFSKLPFDALNKQSRTEKLSSQLLGVCCELFLERSNSREVMEAVSTVFSSIPQGKRTHTLEGLHQDLRIKLASLLGPRGVLAAKLSDPIHATILQLIIVGRHVDISDVARLPIWNGLSEGDPYFLQLVRALGLKGDAKLIATVIKKLSERKVGPAVDDILRILVCAKMREVDMEYTVPVDVNEVGPTSAVAWRAAVAAGVI